MLRSLQLRHKVLEQMIADMTAGGRTDEETRAAIREARVELARIDADLAKYEPPST